MSPNNDNPSLTAEQILERVAERDENALNTAISLAAFAIALVEDGDEEMRASLAWYLRHYADALDSADSGGATH
jgi:hypothetical protein